MTKKEIARLIDLETRINEIALEWGLLTKETLFEVVSAQRVLEGMSYWFPTNFSHWSFGRDYERHRTIYDHTGQGIPYEQVWNFDNPRALLVETNPFALNTLVVAHVFGHVDFFLGSRYCQHGRTFSDVAEEARRASSRFADYESRYGTELERIIDAGMSIMWHQNPDPFFEEQEEETVRERLLAFERAKLERANNSWADFKKPETKEDIRRIERRLEWLQNRTPPEPTYDLLRYITFNSTRPLKPWMVDVLTVLRNQARCLTPNGMTKMLNEGWATYWHVRIMRRLFKEGLLTAEEHDIFNGFHAGVTRETKKGFNWYRIGLALFENIKERWDKGQFGREYDESPDPFKRSRWDTKTNQGDAKIFEVRSFYTDRMAVEDFFTDQFIREQGLYLYESVENYEGEVIDVIVEDDPKTIRQLLKSSMTSSRGPQIVVEDGNHQGKGHLFLKHIYTGFELDPEYREATLDKIQFLWGKRVSIECLADGKKETFNFDHGDRRKR